MIEEEGTYGLYGVLEPPGAGPIQCQTQTIDGTIDIDPSGSYIYVQELHNDGIVEPVAVTMMLYQRLANGSIAFVREGDTTPVIISYQAAVSLDSFDPFEDLPPGPDYIFAVRLGWQHSLSDPTEWGHVIAGYSKYSRSGTFTDVCSSPFPPVVSLSATSGTVNSNLNFLLRRYPIGVKVPITWNGTKIGEVMTNAQGEGHGSLKIPAAPMGSHALRFQYGRWNSTATFTVKPRIKIIPSENIARDQTVNVSLRGYKAREIVRIRWKKGDTFVEIARVTTSSTGSANINVKVPKFVPNGSTSVRGDSVNASGGHAQTNAVTVNGGPLSSSTAKPVPTPTQIALVTPAPSPSSTPALAPTQTIAPQTTTPTDTASPTLTIEPTETPTLAPTVTPSPTADVITTEGSG